MRTLRIVIAIFALAGCDSGRGERCNPLEYSSSGSAGSCGQGLACVTPTGPMCGVAYCCKVDANGQIVDNTPSCQPDPIAAMQCGFDLSSDVADGGHG